MEPLRHCEWPPWRCQPMAGRGRDLTAPRTTYLPEIGLVTGGELEPSRPFLASELQRNACVPG
jgi:hypothetical protein